VCLKAKSEVPEAIKATVQWLETQSGRKLKALRSDRGTEFVNREGRNATPWELFFGVKPNLAALRVFGARAYAHVPEHMRSKLGAKAVQGVMLGC
ncbi:integrase catalytic domain-containing protein, partial [Haematococcus lacustris]